jgi:hypothetical protein
VCVVGLASSPASAQSAPAKSEAKAAKPAGTKDRVTFKTGRSAEGQILSETDTQIVMRVTVSGITAETTFEKEDILAIERGTGPATPEAPKADAAKAPKAETTPADPAASASPDAPKVYYMKLTGVFGRDISETPIREALKDAKRLNADVIVVDFQADWSTEGGVENRKDDESAVNQLFRAIPMDKIFTEELERDWAKMPRVVGWVGTAMGGAAYLPLPIQELYFHGDGKMGGIGKLEQGTQATDASVREKLMSAKLGHMEGMALKGKHDPRLVRAMTRVDYVLSYKIEGGKPVLLERMPEGPDEILLTDDGKEDRKDTDRDLARGLGNDVLTMDAETAFKLGFSSGTADSLDDLLTAMGVARNHVKLNTRSEQVLKGWRDNVASAMREIRSLWRKYGEVTVAPPAGHRERTAARGQQIRILQDMLTLAKRYREAFDPREAGAPSLGDLEILEQRLKLDQQGDRPDRSGGGAGSGTGRPGGGGGGGRGPGGP